MDLSLSGSEFYHVFTIALEKLLLWYKYCLTS